MNSKLFLAVVSTGLLCACSSNDAPVADQSAQSHKVIAFQVAESRATIATATNVRADGFTFSTNWDGATVCDNSKATDNGAGEFTVTPQAFWPNVSAEKPYTFYCVSYPGAPANAIAEAGEKYTTAFTTAANAADQIDMLVAEDVVAAIPENNIEVLHFTHALTRINFNVSVANAPENKGYVWKVKSISVNAKNSGTYTFGDKTWAVGAEAADFEYIQAGDLATVTPTDKWEGQYNLMLIPQHDAVNEELIVTVEWDVFFTTPAGREIQVNIGTASRKYRISTAAWKPSASLRYTNLTLPSIGDKNVDPDNPGSGDGGDDNNMHLIDYDVVVDDWNAESTL